MTEQENLTEDQRTARTSDPLKVLRAFRRLEVGPVKVEPKRLTTPYQVTARDGAKEQFELVYRYEEEVFTPDEPASLNLAGMITAQVALNYGLFCDELVFRGPFDRQDRRFIKAMATNTAREIFVKKILQENPFLRGAATALPPVRRKSYLRARLIFPEAAGQKTGSEDAGALGWTTDSNKHAVLSSGGKDSLLSYGLLNEMGCNADPIFVNESGRHWFTALNAYRHMKGTMPGTARVWTNADRAFSWMLRRFDFIRSDFASVRADDYPIRLWTVAVFLFGALPLLRKRAIGRLLIGNEFDTTRRYSFQGITHYDGLYDQSRYFDNAMTRYFQAKRWGVDQFSILRPLSDLLIEKLLVERYPGLQEHQVSCHAAHVEKNRALPCGRCEKRRRIVGMLSALDADPGHCGYTKQQVEHGLKSLAVKGVHQESDCAEHVVHLLAEKGLLENVEDQTVKARLRPEVLKLRFDPDRSPMDDIPVDLREPLYRICLEHASGAARRSGRIWLETDALDPQELRKPYPFERRRASGAAPRGGAGRRATDGAQNHILAELNWPAAQRRLREVDLALLPVGAIEQHGPHLPLDTDAFDADYLARRVAENCSAPRPLVLPLVPYGVSYHHDDFSGTLSIGPDTLSRLIYEIGMSAARNGISKLVIINGHGGNSPALHFAAQMINRDARIFTCVDTGESSDHDIDALTETPNDVHAGEVETSTALATRPELVDMAAARPFVPEFSSRFLNFTSKRSVGWYTRVAQISPKGVLGDPTKASAEKGRKMWEVMVKNLVEFVEDIRDMSLEEIYQRRY
ncbi:MAG: creatininase family protein [Planctomycetota bacterium]